MIWVRERARRSRPIEPYWGDIPDQPLVVKLPYPRRPKQRRLLEPVKFGVIYVTAAIVGSALLLVAMLVALQFAAQPSLGP